MQQFFAKPQSFGPSITTTALFSGAVAVAYFAQLSGTGGSQPYAWAVVSGSLPPGVSLVGSQLVGTPTTVGPYSFAVQITDAAGSVSNPRTFGITIASVGNYVGAQGQPISYFTPEMPFVNIFKQAGNNGGANGAHTGWFTSTSGLGDTGEENFLALDSDGYVTSLTAIGGHVQTYDRVLTLMNEATTQPGATVSYPSGSYTLQAQGAGTIILGRDMVSGSLGTSSPNITVAGSTITSAAVAGVTWSVTFNVTPTSGSSSGISLQQTAVAAGNYIKAIDIRQTSLVGSTTLYHPLFKACLQNHSMWRGMKWSRVETLDCQIQFAPTGTGLAINATSATLLAINATGVFLGPNWPLPTGTYNFVFATGQIIPVNCTAGQAGVTWSTPLSAAIPSASVQNTASSAQAMFSLVQGWASRSKATNAFYSTAKGIPYEVLFQLGNEMGIDIWANIPFTSLVYDSTFPTQLANLMKSGTGTTLPGFTGLVIAQKGVVEVTNEPWNGAYYSFNGSRMLGALLFPGQSNAGYQGAEYIGVLAANVGDAFAVVYGSALAIGGAITAATRAVVSANGFFTDADYVRHVMNTPDWSSAAYTHNIGAYHTAPYFTNGALLNLTDVTFLLGTAVPLDTFFGLMYSNVVGGHTYTSVPVAGLIGACINSAATDLAGVATQPWATWPLLGYEGGAQWVATSSGATGATLTAWAALLVSATRDIRMGYCYYDPTNQLSVNPGWLPSMKAGGYAWVNHFQLIWAATQSGTYGEYEGVTQPTSGINQPPKAAAIQAYIAA